MLLYRPNADQVHDNVAMTCHAASFLAFLNVPGVYKACRAATVQRRVLWTPAQGHLHVRRWPACDVCVLLASCGGGGVHDDRV